MERLDELENIKVTSMLPWYVYHRKISCDQHTDREDSSSVETPLWTEQPEKMIQFGLQNSEKVTAAEVGKEILSLVEEGKYGGGTLLEITAYGTRVIPNWNISPPPSKLTGISDPESVQRNLGPVKAKLAGERSSVL